ncbi:MAG: hypothetical protein ACLFS3_01830 [Candidatus Aenigmatarchaeota archaeon]
MLTNRKKKDVCRQTGQISMEFMSYMGILLLVFAVFAPLLFTEAFQIYRMRETLVAERIATTLEREINTAVVFGPGYSRNFTLPERIVRSNYTVSTNAENRLLRVSWQDSKETRQIITNNITGGFSSEENRVKIANQDNGIVLRGVEQ